MDKLPRPLVALIDSIVDEYEQFSWNSNCLGDKMRISLIWTRGDLVQINKGVKHKSRSSKQRDNKRLKVWKEKNTVSSFDNSNNIEVDTNENSDTMGNIDFISDGDIDSECEIDALHVPSEQVNITPVVNQPVKRVINTGQTSDKFSRTNIVTIESVETRTNVVKCKQDEKPKYMECKQVNDVKILAPKSIVTGRSPCTDSHFDKIVFSRTTKGEFIIGRVKRRNILVTRNITKRERLKHIDKGSNDTEYTELCSKLLQYTDMRKASNEDCRQCRHEIPDMEKYVEDFRLCPYCFQ